MPDAYYTTKDVAEHCGITQQHLTRLIAAPQSGIPDCAVKVGTRKIRAWTPAEIEAVQEAVAKRLQQILKDTAPTQALKSRPLIERLTNANTLMSGTAPDVLLTSEQVCDALQISREQLYKFTEKYAHMRYGCRLKPIRQRGKREVKFSAQMVLAWLTILEKRQRERH